MVLNPHIPEVDTQADRETGYDLYVDMEVALPRGPDGQPQFERVIKQQRGPDGLPIGTGHAKPLLDTRMYTVEYLDSHQAALRANQIAENLFTHINEHRQRYVLIDEITDH